MSQTENKAFYLKYRPQNLDEVIGQEQVTKVLNDSFSNNKISHAYLFSGSRGTGKTSVARILANMLETTKNDLYEIDAASNNGVDEIRNLKEAVLTLPLESKYKVYILDEVHMLSKQAFNALLKTLEEPPKHVIFILATTEIEKIPETIISRCENYQFKKPNRSVLQKIAIDTAKKEGFDLDKDAADLLTIVADGSFRDLQTNLQKLINSSSDKKLTLKEAEIVTAAPKSEIINEFIASILKKDVDNSLKIINQAKQENFDVKIFLKLLLEKCRIALIIKVAEKEVSLYQDLISDDEINILKNLIKDNSPNLNSKLLAKLLKVYEDSFYSALPFLPIELFVIELSEK